MAAASWLVGTVSTTMHVAATFSISLGPSGNLQEIGVMAFSAILRVSSLVSIVVSYVRIFRTVLTMPSAEGRAIAFSTCQPHHDMVILFISTGSVAHFKPSSDSSSTLDLLSSVFYNVLEKILFVVVLIFYVLTLVGNTAIILVTRLDLRLHTAMYFFLFHLSLVDLCFTTSIVPQLLWNLRGPFKAITVVGCVVQLYVSLALGSTERVLLAVMALDRHAAFCLPLYYTTVMHPRLFRALVGLVWLSEVRDTVIQDTVIFCLPGCGHPQLTLFLCEMPAMLKLACADVWVNEIQLFVGTLVMILLPLSLITVSCGSIARAMLRIKSPRVWRKALDSCGSHLLVVTLFNVSITVVCIWPNNSFSGTLDKFLTLF
ncbi:olfactory receptor 2G3-like [Tachyglossus aculeatus]|uniref:olfactory receptor 2G3-like n=1 Tax=Tachyglossus aculeatus TaxID=9261 RepID=UPI0018F79585|nr:olfactory receptor 2G3-like [Tachyglossus aculeatus]